MLIHQHSSKRQAGYITSWFKKQVWWCISLDRILYININNSNLCNIFTNNIWASWRWIRHHAITVLLIWLLFFFSIVCMIHNINFSNIVNGNIGLRKNVILYPKPYTRCHSLGLRHSFAYPPRNSGDIRRPPPRPDLDVNTLYIFFYTPLDV